MKGREWRLLNLFSADNLVRGKSEENLSVMIRALKVKADKSKVMMLGGE